MVIPDKSDLPYKSSAMHSQLRMCIAFQAWELAHASVAVLCRLDGAGRSKSSAQVIDLTDELQPGPPGRQQGRLAEPHSGDNLANQPGSSLANLFIGPILESKAQRYLDALDRCVPIPPLPKFNGPHLRLEYPCKLAECP